MSRRASISVFETGISRVELRIAPRYPILQRCFAQPVAPPEPQAWRCIAFNVSATGIGIALPVELPEGTLLTVQAYNLPGTSTLQARVIHSRPVESLWFTGCEWLAFLSEDELENWCSGPMDWVENQQS
jgi:hypothetical protein